MSPTRPYPPKGSLAPRASFPEGRPRPIRALSPKTQAGCNHAAVAATSRGPNRARRGQGSRRPRVGPPRGRSLRGSMRKVRRDRNGNRGQKREGGRRQWGAAGAREGQRHERQQGRGRPKGRAKAQAEAGGGQAQRKGKGTGGRGGGGRRKGRAKAWAAAGELRGTVKGTDKTAGRREPMVLDLTSASMIQKIPTANKSSRYTLCNPCNKLRTLDQ